LCSPTSEFDPNVWSGRALRTRLLSLTRNERRNIDLDQAIPKSTGFETLADDSTFRVTGAVR
jgi:hypothetical protein